MLGGSDRMGALRLKLRETGFTNGEEDNATFTFIRREIGSYHEETVTSS
ncbi:hypothetical protein L915_00098 [Phytophthora nicotianae]|uniref:Uncharacterized protein n=1 Tax=Phytophthora nicotianae TaxID=4792 RepID=W2HS39_PHYNI|nr:hypothetical protein L915_00098 [Phytophthora nicotianae]